MRQPAAAMPPARIFGSNMIKSIIFDIDDTLYDYGAAHGIALNTVAAFAEGALGLSPDAFRALHGETFHRQAERCGPTAASHSRLIRFQMMLEALHGPVALAPEMESLYWTALMACMKPMPGAVETLARLRDMGLTLGVGTNMTAQWQFAKLNRLGMMPLMDFIVTSEEAGVEKPAAGFFQLCAEKAGHAPGECAFVGDNLEGDALGALDAGMAAFWLCRDPEPADAPDGITRIQTLSELPALIESH